MKINSKQLLTGTLVFLVLVIWWKVFHNVQKQATNNLEENKIENLGNQLLIVEKQSVPIGKIFNPFELNQYAKNTSKPIKRTIKKPTSKKITKEKPLQKIEIQVTYKGSLNDDNGVLAYLKVNGNSRNLRLKDTLIKGVILEQVWNDSIKITINGEKKIIYR